MTTQIIETGQNTITGQQLDGSLFMDFVSWVDRCEKTTRTYLQNLKQFAAWLKYAAITAPQRQDIISYRDWLSMEHEAISLAPGTAAGWIYRTDKKGDPVRVTCKPSTVKGYLQTVRQFFKWTASNGFYPNIAENIHPPKIRQDRHKKDALHADDVAKIEASINTANKEKIEQAAVAKKDRTGRTTRATEQAARLNALYILTVTAGLRTVEIRRANVKDFEQRGGKSWLWIHGKGHAEADEKLPLAPEVGQAIRDYLDIRADHPTADSPLFVGVGNRSGGRRLAETTISTMLKQAMKDAGYNSERITAHSLRHTAGTAAQEVTGDIYQTQKYMRHSSPVTTEIYIHDRDTEKQEATAQSIYNLFHGITETDGRARLEGILDRLNASQIDQLAGLAEAMA